MSQQMPSPYRIPVVCANDECGYFGKVRVVTGQHLGQDLYLMTPIYCGCGQVALSVTDDQAHELEGLTEGPTAAQVLAVVYAEKT